MLEDQLPEDLVKALKQAADTGRFFISISYLDPKKKKKENLQHSWFQENFPNEDVQPSLRMVSQDYQTTATRSQLN